MAWLKSIDFEFTNKTEIDGTKIEVIPLNSEKTTQIHLQKDCSNVHWEEVSALLERVGMHAHEPERMKKAFENSYAVAFLFDEETLIGCARGLSDGAYQTAIYDVAVSPEYQGRHLGKTLVESILQDTPECNAILYASPGKEPFYERLGFASMQTGMAKFIDMDSSRQRGMIR